MSPEAMKPGGLIIGCHETLTLSRPSSDLLIAARRELRNRPGVRHVELTEGPARRADRWWMTLHQWWGVST